jgi:hypothetical protein
MKLSRYCFLVLLAIFPGGRGLSAESLWTPGFDGYLGARNGVQAGDVVFVQIDTGTSLSFEASSSDAKSLTFEFSGGEFGNLFSFLPAARTGGTLSTKGKQDFALRTEVAARVAQVDQGGKALLRGTRNFFLENKQEALSISGWIDPVALGPDRRISFSQLADSQLRFQTFLQPAAPTLTRADIQELIQALQPQAPGGGAAPGGAPQPAGAPAAGAPAAAAGGPTPVSPLAERRSYTLSDEKKIELFLTYINRMVDLLFQ